MEIDSDGKWSCPHLQDSVFILKRGPCFWYQEHMPQLDATLYLSLRFNRLQTLKKKATPRAASLRMASQINYICAESVASPRSIIILDIVSAGTDNGIC